MHEKLRKTFSYLRRQDINLTGFIKYLADLGPGLKFISAAASPLFILLNINTVIFSRNALLCLCLFIPTIFLAPSIEVVRIIFSISILWIFFKKFESNSSFISNTMLIASMLYALLLFSGIFDSGNYFVMGNGELRYKFILESHNALCVPTLFAFVFLINGMVHENKKSKLIQMSAFIALILLMIVLVLIKSRLYIGLSFALIAAVAIINRRKTWLPLIATAIYLLFFVAMTTIFKEFISSNASFSKITNSERILSLNGTGREKLTNAFYELVSEKGWQRFIYQNNAVLYIEKKKAIPGIKLEDSTLTESSYFVTILYTGFLGLLAIILTSVGMVYYFLKKKEYFSLLYLLLMMGVWYFEETILFPLSLIAQLFALFTINLLEKNSNSESSLSN